MAPQNIQNIPEPLNITFYDKWDFADVIKDIETGRLPWIIQGGLKCNHKCPYKSEAEGDLFTEEEGNVATEARCYLLALKMKEGALSQGM